MTGKRRFGLLMMVAFAAGGATATALAEEPHLARALSALGDARDDLSATHDNKDGHPKAAMALIDRAVAEIRAVGQ
ncbi:MAG TPA: hypothetical protein VL752_02100 [Acidisoma sp.]|jgi:hypothetical protein|uniref:hypothetical protein n=1 Tax=Acidisoma sp. TaxID=1872115 RepID=UPI002BDDF9A6|nr:hypothetical protein [Acidisoma sp.]HTH99712.1 hypothetical protein [Acidisoma sp.]